MKYPKVDYNLLNAKQKEKYNYQKVSAFLADYGFITIPLSDDWNGADFLAVHKDGDTLKVQLKGRMTFNQKYLGKDLYVCFCEKEEWFLYPHDELFKAVCGEIDILNSDSWKNDGLYSFPKLSEKYKIHLKALDVFKSVA